MPRHWLVAMHGARMHYAVPSLLAEAGGLAHFYTDFLAASVGYRVLGGLPARLIPNSLRRVADRFPKGIDKQSMTGFNTFGLEYYRRKVRAKTPEQETAACVLAQILR